MFGFLKRNVRPTDISRTTTQDIENFLKTETPTLAGEFIRKAAQAGSTDAALFLSTMLIRVIEMKGKNSVPQSVLDEYVIYTQLAAQKGEVTAQMNLAKHFVSISRNPDGTMNAEGYESLKKAEHWYRKAAAAGFEPAMGSLNNMKSVFDWAHATFGEKSMYGASEDDQLTQTQISAHRCARSLCSAIEDRDVIWQLILEDIEGASMGNDKSKLFAMSSGISPDTYRGALNRSRPEVDGPKGIKTFLDEQALDLLPDRDKMVEFRLATTDYIMRYFKLGRYAD